MDPSAKDLPPYDPTSDSLPSFDPKALCAKCGWSIPDPPPPEPKFGPKGADGTQKQLPAPPPAPPTPPNVEYCNGAQCPWEEADGEDHVPRGEHLHAFCDVCGYEWLAATLDNS